LGRKPKDTTSYLRALREERDISLTELVNKIGYTKGYVSAVETGLSRATPAFLKAYERALELAPGSLSAFESGQVTNVSTVLSTVQTGFGPTHNLETLAPKPLSRASSNGAVIEGVQSLLLQAITLVTAAAQHTPLPGAEIIVTFQSEHDPLTIYPDLAPTWRAALRQALNAGWNIVHLWRLHGDTDRRFALIVKMLSMLGYRGQYLPYIFPPHIAPVVSTDLLIVPGQGALSMFGSRQARHVDTGFFFPADSSHFSMLSQYASTMRAQTQPLLEVFSERSLDFKTASLHVEAEPGDQLLLKEGLALQVMPTSIRAAYIERILQVQTDRNEQEQISLRLWCQTLLEYHARRVLMFENYLRDGAYVARHIVAKSALEALFQRGELPVDDWLRNEANSQLTPEEVVLWVRHVIHLLETYPTYHLGLVDSLEDNIIPVYWKVEGRQTIILESWQQPDAASSKRDNVNILLHDPAIAKSFRDHFVAFWEGLPAEQVDKVAVIAWLNAQIAALAESSG